MIVSFDIIKCGRQIYFFNKRLLFSREMWNTIIYFFKKKLLLLKKHFETVMLMWPKNFFNFVILQYIQWIFI